MKYDIVYQFTKKGNLLDYFYEKCDELGIAYVLVSVIHFCLPFRKLWRDLFCFYQEEIWRGG